MRPLKPILTAFHASKALIKLINSSYLRIILKYVFVNVIILKYINIVQYFNEIYRTNLSVREPILYAQWAEKRRLGTDRLQNSDAKRIWPRYCEITQLQERNSKIRRASEILRTLRARLWCTLWTIFIRFLNKNTLIKILIINKKCFEMAKPWRSFSNQRRFLSQVQANSSNEIITLLVIRGAFDPFQRLFVRERHYHVSDR